MRRDAFGGREAPGPVGELSALYITIAIRLRYDDTTTHSATTKVIEITICVRFDCDIYDYDTTTTKNWHVHFLLASNGSRRTRYVVIGLYQFAEAEFDLVCCRRTSRILPAQNSPTIFISGSAATARRPVTNDCDNKYERYYGPGRACAQQL